MWMATRPPRAAGDWNGDGYDDVAALQRLGTGVRIFYGPITASQTAAAASATLSVSIYEGGGLASGGDLTGDGRDDLVVGVPSAALIPASWPWPALAPGAAYIVDSAPTGSHTLASVSTPVFGALNFGDAGSSVAVGDWDGDGALDLALGAPHTASTASGAGRVYLVPGPITEALVRDEGSPHIDGGGPGWFFGSSLTNVGDVGGDLGEDLIIGTPGRGAFLPTTFGVQALWADLPTAFAEEGTELATWAGGGGAASGVGDWNGDGWGDLALWWTSGTSRSVRLFLGPFDGAQAWSAARGIFTTGYVGGAAGGMARVPDLDGDGLDELLVGDPDLEVAVWPTTRTPGGAFLIWGGTTGTESLASITDTWLGSGSPYSNTRMGGDVAYAGDVDGDGDPEFLLKGPAGSAPNQAVVIVSAP